LSRSHRGPRPQALLDAIEARIPVKLAGELWRVVAGGRDPLQPGRAGGRWDDGTFDMLYTSSERDGALAEAWYHVTRGQPIPPSKPARRIHKIEADLDRVLDLASAGSLAALGVDMTVYGRLSYVQRPSEYSTTQQIAEVAFFYEFQALIVPNARWPTSNVVILTEHAKPSQLSADAGEGVDLVAWYAGSRRAK
jgi:RES domain-containing protein